MNGYGEKLDALDAIRAEVSKVVLGQTGLIDKLLIALLADGHILLEGVPGLAKTQVIRIVNDAPGVGVLVIDPYVQFPATHGLKGYTEGAEFHQELLLWTRLFFFIFI